jgi:hypothetical protein
LCSNWNSKRPYNRILINEPINEINNFLECRCVTPNDGSWRLLQFDIHDTDPSGERLPVHLPFENKIVFIEDDDLEEVIENLRNVRTKLTGWLKINNTSPSARNYAYIEFPEYFTWHADGKSWSTTCAKHNKISCIAHVSPTEGETYYLHMLLHIVKGAKSFSEIQTIAGHEYPTFRLSCQSLGLLGDDQKWSYALNDAAQWDSPYQLRQLFVTILVFYEVSDPLKLYGDHSSHMSEDIIYRMNRVSSISNNSAMENFVTSSLLFELEKLLQNVGYSLSHFSLPIPDDIGAASTDNMLILHELSYDTNYLASSTETDIHRLNNCQKNVSNAVCYSVLNNEGENLFCLWLWRD